MLGKLGNRPPGAPDDVEVLPPPRNGYGRVRLVAGIAGGATSLVFTWQWLFRGETGARGATITSLALLVVGGFATGPLIGRRAHAFSGPLMWQRDVWRRWTGSVDLRSVRAVGAFSGAVRGGRRTILWSLVEDHSAPLLPGRKLGNLMGAEVADRFADEPGLALFRIGDPVMLGRPTLSRLANALRASDAFVSPRAAAVLGFRDGDRARSPQIP